MGLYSALFDLYGPQEWWPADSPWEVCVGAILTQNTNWGNVEKAILNLKNAGLLGKGGEKTDPGKLLGIKPEKLAELIRPSGYFNLKTKRLISLTEWWIKNQHEGVTKFKIIDIPALRDSILQIHGIGPENSRYYHSLCI